jgi:hypothetical protein
MIIVFGFLPVLAMAPAYVAAANTTNDKLFSGCTGSAASSPICQDKNTQNDPVLDTMKTVANIIALATGVIAVIMVIISGIRMITANGNTESIANARKRITYALVGLVIVSFAWLMVSFVIDRLIK